MLIEAKDERPAGQAETDPNAVLGALYLMSALKRSLAEETGVATKPRRRAAGDRRQTNLLLPVSGKKEKETPTQARTTAAARRRKA